MSPWPPEWLIQRRACLLRSGGVVACPAEAVWGLSCNPWDKSAVLKICALKRRSLDKGLILVSGDVSDFEAVLVKLPAEERDAVCASWPGSITWLVPNCDVFPDWITGNSDDVAIRVTCAPILVSLSRAVGSPIVSTSANPAGAQPARSRFQVAEYFGPDLVTLPGTVNLAANPSTIKRVGSNEVIRF